MAQRYMDLMGKNVHRLFYVIVLCGQLLKLIPTHINKVVKYVLQLMVMTSIVLVYGVKLVSSMVSTMVL
jgi:hypothetical protein